MSSLVLTHPNNSVLTLSQSEWSKFYPPGAEVLANIERTVDKYKLRDLIHTQHELTHARWDDAAGKWTIRVRREIVPNAQHEEFEETCDILVLCVGSLNRWRWPDIPGLNDFQGKIVHTADYTLTDEDVRGKNVGVIGNVGLFLVQNYRQVLNNRFFKGSSGIQTVAALHPKVKNLVTYARQKTWIAPDFSINDMKAQLGRKPDDPDSMWLQLYIFPPGTHEPPQLNSHKRKSSDWLILNTRKNSDTTSNTASTCASRSLSSAYRC
jgi:cation diffusion facilitator CzcD-associated flavoprotein CzcO